MSSNILSDIMQGGGLPTLDMVGTSNDSEFTIPVADSNVTTGILTETFMGDFIALASTYRPEHFRHPNTEYMDVTSGLKCNRCRWFELRIFYNHVDSCYVLHFAGRTIVPGEIQRFRVDRAVSAYEVIEILSAKTSHGRQPGNSEGPYLTAPALRALSQAAGFDDDIRDAFNARRAKL